MCTTDQIGAAVWSYDEASTFISQAFQRADPQSADEDGTGPHCIVGAELPLRRVDPSETLTPCGAGAVDGCG
jgi:hypothetical protein